MVKRRNYFGLGILFLLLNLEMFCGFGGLLCLVTDRYLELLLDLMRLSVQVCQAERVTFSVPAPQWLSAATTSGQQLAAVVPD